MARERKLNRAKRGEEWLADNAEPASRAYHLLELLQHIPGYTPGMTGSMSPEQATAFRSLMYMAIDLRKALQLSLVLLGKDPPESTRDMVRLLSAVARNESQKSRKHSAATADSNRERSQGMTDQCAAAVLEAYFALLRDPTRKRAPGRTAVTNTARKALAEAGVPPSERGGVTESRVQKIIEDLKRPPSDKLPASGGLLGLLK